MTSYHQDQKTKDRIKEISNTMDIDSKTFNNEQKKRKQKGKIKSEFVPEFNVCTKVRLRFKDMVIAKHQTINVAVNRGYDGKHNLGYYFIKNNKKYCISKKEVTTIGRVE